MDRNSHERARINHGHPQKFGLVYGTAEHNGFECSHPICKRRTAPCNPSNHQRACNQKWDRKKDSEMRDAGDGARIIS